MKIFWTFTLMIPGVLSSISVTGYSGEGVNITCRYDRGYTDNNKYFCKGQNPGCTDLIKMYKKNGEKRVDSGRFSLYDDPSAAFFTVTIRDVSEQDSGTYQCAVDIYLLEDVYSEVKLNIVTAYPSVDPCYNYTVLDDPWRANSSQPSNSYKCDQSVSWSGWYRFFINGLSAQIPDTCVDEYSCGTAAPLWIRDGHPTVQEGVVTRGVCGHWISYCCYYGAYPIKVKACPGNYYVYELVRPKDRNLAYCAVVTNISSTHTTVAPETSSAGEFLLVTAYPSVDPCYNYTVLDDPWRTNSSQLSNSYKCDQSVSWRGWYRLFINGLSAQIPDTCVDEYSCGTHIPLWIHDGHPTVQDGVITRGVCGHYNNTCCHFSSNPIKVKACPGNYYVYELLSPTICNSAYCAVVTNISSTHTTVAPETSSAVRDIKVPEDCNSQTPGGCFQKIFEQIETITDQVFPLNTVTDILTVAFNASEKIIESSSSASRAELASYGNRVLKTSEKLISTLVKPTDTSASVNFTLPAIEGQVFMVGPKVTLHKMPRLDTTNSSVDIDLIGMSKNNTERSAAVAFMSYVTMENLLKPDFFNTSNDTVKTMMSTVISVTLPKTTNTKLTKPVNFTFRHIREFDPSGSLSCVYWNINEWIVDGCSVLKTNSNYTVCSCVHLSTFALIMQTSRQPESQNPGGCFLNIFEQIETIKDQVLPLNTVTNLLTEAFNASEKIVESSSSASPTELASYGNRVLKTSEKLISTLVKPTVTSASVNFTLPAVEGQVFMVGPQVNLKKIPRLAMTNSSVDIDLIGISKNNIERSAAVAFMSYVTMENLLKPDFFNTSNDTVKTMMSTVISVTLPKTTNTKLTKPVNFTFRHIREFDPSGSLSCVYWNINEWIVDGCSVLETNSSYTVCSCVHLSTFALIMQTSRQPESQTPGGCFQNIFEQIENISAQEFPLNTVTDILTEAFNASEKIVQSSSSASPTELASYGNRVLKTSEKLISTLVKPTVTSASVNFTLPAVEGQVFMVGPQVTLNKIPRLAMTNSSVDIDLIGISKNNNGSAAVAFMSYVMMENLLKPDFFNTSNDTVKTMMSTVISVTLPKTTNTRLTKPVNFTFRHIREFRSSGFLSCVYWNISEWIVDGCSVLKTNSSYTVCSCDHLSTFALIMQTSCTPESDSLVELLNLVCVIVGLVFFSLALLTFALCQWSPLVNNVARINICISLLLAHLLFLLTQPFLSLLRHQQVLCAVISGLLHFLFLSGFVWMFIEAVLLFICVKNLSKISSKKRMVLSTGFLCVIGYVVALVVVCVSVGLVPEGYGSKDCWIKIDKGFIWSFLGPVCVILASNTILFINIVISLNSALRCLNAEVSQIKQTKIMVFKTMAQFVVLGCPWILGFFSNNSKVLEILFLILNSQQGTFIFLIYCVLNNKVREQYRKFFRCLCSKNTEDHSITFRIITTE
ncbi:uncharacterized protein LOC127948716 isoform X2 [Carassius gibelio]|uniref:uncharacterized protein LOC127948716 isoform X2 n=1 Tax=Carassius gibelio TaxID=101364 RepID=UPI002279084C|nr:uncharacterized protein LOC127948716 isoform X2 [Carassius gibelio]